MAGNQLIFSFAGDDSKLTPVVQRTKKNIQRLVTAQGNLNKKFEKGSITAAEYARKSDRVSKMMDRESMSAKKLGITVQNLDKNFKRLNTTSRGRGGAALAIQELGRGIADFKAGGGFQDFSRGMLGATNNLERMAETMQYVIKDSKGLKGALKAIGQQLIGPAGVVLAITLLLQFLPDIINFFTEWAGSTSQAKDEISKLEGELQKLREGADLTGKTTIEDQIKAKWDEIIAKQDEYIKKLKDLAKDSEGGSFLSGVDLFGLGGPSVSGAIRAKNLGFAELQQLVNETVKQQDLDELARLKQREKSAKEYAKALKDAKEHDMDLQDILDPEGALKRKAGMYKSALSDVLGDVELENLFGGVQTEFEEDGYKIIDPDQVMVLEEVANDLDNINQILKDQKSLYADLDVGTSKTLMNTLEGLEKQKVGWDDVADSTIQAFSGAIQSNGNMLEDFANGIFQTLGSLAIKEGSFYVASGKAKLIATKGATGGSEVAGGLALIAAGSAIKAGARASSGGGGSARQSNIGREASSGSAKQISTNSDSANNGMVAVAKVKGQDLILALQNAEYSRQGYIPT